jgi:hypothetical protein
MSSLNPDLIKNKKIVNPNLGTNVTDLSDWVLLEAYIYVYYFNSIILTTTCIDSIVLDTRAVCFLSVGTQLSHFTSYR